MKDVVFFILFLGVFNGLFCTVSGHLLVQSVVR